MLVLKKKNTEPQNRGRGILCSERNTEGRPETELSEELPTPAPLDPSMLSPWSAAAVYPLFSFSIIINNHFMGRQLISVKHVLHEALAFLCGETVPAAFSTAVLGLLLVGSLVKC